MTQLEAAKLQLCGRGDPYLRLLGLGCDRASPASRDEGMIAQGEAGTQIRPCVGRTGEAEPWVEGPYKPGVGFNRRHTFREGSSPSANSRTFATSVALFACVFVRSSTSLS